MQNFKLIEEFQEAMSFLNDHPGLNQGSGSFFYGNLSFWVNSVCKNNVIHDPKSSHPAVVHYKNGSEGYEKYKNDNRYNEDIDESCLLDALEIPYLEVYGYDWALDHYQYAGEFCIFKYTGTKLDRFASYNDWERLEGEYSKADSFEQLIINLANLAKESYGNFKYDDFYTTEEKLNNQKHRMLLPMTKGDNIVHFNPAYTHVYDCQLSNRWWDWYRNTDHCKEHWGDK